jgi:hypothetical protein
MSEEDPYVGMTMAEAKRRLEGFSAKRIQTINEIIELHVDPSGDNFPPRYFQLRASLASLEKNIDETREWYLIGLLEALHESEEKQIAATNALHKSSRSLELLTSALFILTAVLASVGSGSYFLQALQASGITGFSAVTLASLGAIVVAGVVVVALFLLKQSYADVTHR